ncbi:MAG: IPT/TIG domain-containing protein [Chitinophagaceae bacterium]|nr:IPT/TIG domain-containing protein [Chitinophagaceae bacterium]
MKIKLIFLCCIGSLLFFASCKKDKEPVPQPAPSQTVTAITPSSGPKNTVVNIRGTNFGTSTAILKVYFNNVQGTIQSANDTLITAVVPANAGTGIVKVEKSGTQVNGPSFEYFVAARVLTYAGSSIGYADGNAGASQFNIVSGVVKDAAGNLFVCDRDNHRIRKITPAGVVSTFAGGASGFVDGTGTAARFNQPYCITIDATGNLYVGDRMNHAIRKITPTGVVTTLAGNGTPGSQNGTGSAATFAEPLGIATDAAGNIFVADYLNGLIRKITPAGVVTTLLSPGQVFGLVFDASNNLYYTTYNSHQIMKYSSMGASSVIAGQSGTSGTEDGTGTAARFNFPSGITVDGNGNLYVCDAMSHRIRKITSAGVVTTFAGNNAGVTDGIGSSAAFNTPLAVCGDFNKNVIYIADFNNHRIRKVVVD